MTARQFLLKQFYPLLMKVTGKNAKVLVNKNNLHPPQSFYELKTLLNNGTELPFESLRNKKVLIVNTASDCGYTAQYENLERLYEQYHDKLVIIAFPANDFKQQEKEDDAAIASFCEKNYGITFPVAKKSVVIKEDAQHPVFKWLTNKHLNGWNDDPPNWNFSKYLINEQGVLTHYFDPAVSPLSNAVIHSIIN